MLINPFIFTSTNASHRHARDTLDLLGGYVDFMRSVDSVCDIGCGTGQDLEWWASRTINDDAGTSVPYDIKCTGIDILPKLNIADRYENIQYIKRDFELKPANKTAYDILWCHDAFQYAINPLKTLTHFYNMLTPGGMLCIIVPQTTNVIYHKQEFDQPNGQFFNYTLVSLIHMLAMSGFDCNTGFFKKNFEDPWIHAIVYKSDHKPMNPRTTTWHDLLEKGLLPASAEKSVNRCGYVRQCDLVLPWLDKSNRDYGQQ